MSTIAIIGAGKGLGLAVARRFGREGYAVALLARSQDNLDTLTDTLWTEGIHAVGLTADVRDPGSLQVALNRAASALGPVNVLQYSPVPAPEFMLPVLETAAVDLVGPVEFSIYGPVTAARQVIPACGLWAAELSFLSTAPARSGPTGQLPALPSPSPAKVPTRNCSTMPSPRRESTWAN